MKVFISADIEGMAGVAAVEETDPDHKDYPRHALQMTREVAAACEGALAAGATDILVKDAHWHGRNIDPAGLPEGVRIDRGWSGHPQSMSDGLDDSFAASLFIGYHSRAGAAGNPLAHTMAGRVVQELLINDRPASEFLIQCHTSNMHGVPTAFLSGDAALCVEAETQVPGIGTYATFEGTGLSIRSQHPQTAADGIRAGVEASLRRDLDGLLRPNPDHFHVRVEYKQPPVAYRRSFFPGAALENERFVHFESKNWFDVLTFFTFAL